MRVKLFAAVVVVALAGAAEPMARAEGHMGKVMRFFGVGKQAPAATAPAASNSARLAPSSSRAPSASMRGSSSSWATPSPLMPTVGIDTAGNLFVGAGGFGIDTQGNAVIGGGGFGIALTPSSF
jgi:hypothetical protein